MAPSAPPSARPRTGAGSEDDEYYGINKGDRKTRKPLVEKKRRARINESLQELRSLLADTDLQSKMENAEVLEMTVRRVERILKNRTQETESLNREASERFTAGYIQCMHEVHMFVSSCPGIDATVAAELLNHLLESMPLNEETFQDMFMDLITDTSGNHGSTWPVGEALCVALASPGGRSLSSGSASALSPTSSSSSPALSLTSSSTSALSPAPSSPSSEDLSCSDLDETDGEQSQSSTETENHREAQHTPPTVPYSTAAYSKSMWRPW